MASKDVAKDASHAADPDAQMLSYSCFDMLLIELVPMAQRLAEQLLIQEKEFLTKHKLPLSAHSRENPDPNKVDEEEVREATFYRLENLGYRVGLGLVESLTANLPLPSRTTPLDTIKFICKDFWTAVFRKQIDNLKTNHRGVFVLTDNRFEPLRRCSLEAGKMEEARARAGPFLFFPAGLVRGALSGLGIEASVQAEVAGIGLPGAVFSIKTGGSK